ncbi:MAG TPA: diacylglycerol kinase family lipid kinase [Candidatus Aminicenantes bacterium]|nr:diacylglycerol kinase family lipid kinase [Candidatus Aminicenantes bacterium]HRY64848.1 diacylglycerol kinase family lipid kinase [Candidatus Aminicenantes bacterium]HRZ71761.1 diacylglycerol kinase family lipid kinase [Candidatus Aminicenantes bacterium]
MKTLLLVNPAAGHGRGRKVFESLEPRLRGAFPGLEVRFSERAGHAVEIGREAAAIGFDRVLCLGGDGTPYEFLNGLYAGGRPDRRPEIGLIPAGTGNSFLRDFGLETPDRALDAILAGRSRKVDLVEFEDQERGRTARRYSLNIIGVGLIADILRLTNERLKFLGAAGYSAAVLIRLARGMSNRIVIEADGKRLEAPDSALVISNSKYTGGGMKIAPPADTSDGRADLVLFNGVNRRQIVSIFSGVFSGRHAGHPRVHMRQAAAISVEADPPLRLMADGELAGWTPLRIKVLPGEIDLLA